ncbi:MAG: glycosyl transferase, family 2, partial [uncultured Phycisphaerae bacterium]
VGAGLVRIERNPARRGPGAHRRPGRAAAATRSAAAADRRARRRLQRREHAPQRPAPDPRADRPEDLRDLHLRRRQLGQHDQRRQRVPGRAAAREDHGLPEPREPDVRREPGPRVHVRHGAGPGHRRAAARRRPVRPGGDAGPVDPAGAGRGRLRHGQPDDGQGGRPQGQHADVQVRRQQGADDAGEHADRHPADRVPQRVPGLLGPGAEADPARPADVQLALRHPDHHRAAEEELPDQGSADPDVLRRRDLPRERHPVRDELREGSRQVLPVRPLETPPKWPPRRNRQPRRHDPTRHRRRRPRTTGSTTIRRAATSRSPGSCGSCDL